MLHPSTTARISSYLDEELDDGIISVSISDVEDREDELVHSIISAQVDHYSFNEIEQFMIVKTIEEMHDDDGQYNVVQTLRIFQEQANPELQKLPCNHFKAENTETENKDNIKGKISAFLKGKVSMNKTDQNSQYSRGIPRYKLIE